MVPADDVLIDGVVRLGVVPELVDVLVPVLLDEPVWSTVVPTDSWLSVDVPSPIRFVVSTAAEDDVPRSVVSAENGNGPKRKECELNFQRKKTSAFSNSAIY